MKIIEMEREDLLRERKRIEARVTRNLLRTNATIFTLPKTNYGMILSFSPFNINSCTNSFVKSESRWKYSHISNRLHTYEDKRNILEKEMRLFNHYFALFRHVFHGSKRLYSYNTFKIHLL